MKLIAAALTLLLASPLLATAQMQDAHTPAQHAQGNSGDDMHADKPPVPPSKFLNVTFEGKTITLTVDDLLKMPQTTLHVHNAHRNTDETYTGPLLSDVLEKAGLHNTREFEPMILHSGIVATATDHYFVLYSAAEVEPGFSNGKVIVAIMKSDLPNTEGGVIQLINNNSDAKPARWVHGLSNISVMSIAPAQ
jgi:hypothetical protein